MRRSLILLSAIASGLAGGCNQSNGNGAAPGAPDASFAVFELSADPTEVTIGLGDTKTFGVTVSYQPGFQTTDIPFSAPGLPAGNSVSFDPNPLPHQGTAVAIVSTQAGTTASAACTPPPGAETAMSSPGRARPGRSPLWAGARDICMACTPASAETTG